ncbi:HK97 family phage major capsid protein [Microbacterium proteolyticum]|uniref:HK97 family phage major capsid protein n=2 Tax=Microbacterium proteolyticum TaxID=1572644 RepID=A0A7W5CF90_9MICO|nr:HK97 family phage major capsid protein [Microbacterium proteolyticum]
MNMKEQIRAELDKAKAIVATAEKAGREMTEQEISDADTHLKTVKGLRSQLEAADGSTAVKNALDALNGEFAGTKSKAPSRGYKAARSASWAKSTDEILRAVASSGGAKALTSGTVDVPAVIGDPGEIPARPHTVLDLIVGRDRPADGNGNAIQYLRQTQRPTGAAAVADGALKPTGIATFTDVEDRLRTVAILSEPLPIRYLTDFRGLTDILRVQLGEAVITAVEDLVVSGNGSGENFTGILQTSGIQTQARSTSIAGLDYRLETSLKAKTKADEIGGTPATGYVLNPTDWENITLARIAKNPANEAEEGAKHLLHDLPVVTSTAIALGTGLVGDFSTLELVTRETDRVDIDTAGELFTKNQFRLRVEGRYTLKVGRPNAFCRFDLTPAT